MATSRLGGCFAPPLTDELMAKYKVMIDALDPQLQLRDVLGKLHACVAKWWELPESNGTGKPHPVGTFSMGGKPVKAPAMIDLEESHQKELWESIPWDEELAVMTVACDKISNETDKPLRNAAHHLLWHVVELSKDREPLTADKIQ